MNISIFKQISLGLITILLLSTFLGCGTNETPTAQTQEQKAVIEEKANLSLTLDELSTFDGKSDNPAYIAVDGVIYDVTNVPQWVGGMHRGFSAGNDVTQDVMDSPHGKSKLSGIPIVGEVIK